MVSSFTTTSRITRRLFMKRSARCGSVMVTRVSGLFLSHALKLAGAGYSSRHLFSLLIRPTRPSLHGFMGHHIWRPLKHFLLTASPTASARVEKVHLLSHQPMRSSAFSQARCGLVIM